MKLLITYTELQILISQKTGKEIHLQKAGGENTVKVTYIVRIDVPLIGKVSKDIEGEIKINGIQNMTLDFSYSLPMGLDLAAKGVKTFLWEQIESSQVMKWGEKENQVFLFVDKLAEKLHVNNVEKMKQYIQLTDLQAVKEGLEVWADLI